MGCQKLDTDFCNFLEIAYSEKRDYDEKICVNYYPFGLQHKGYNDVVNSNSNSVASKFKFNGTELEESLGSNLYEMPLRSYDPAIARWTTIDPVVHYAMSTYNAFDNNPVTFPDPSGGDVIDIKGGVKFTGQDAIDFFKSSILSNSGNGGGDGTDWQNAFQQQGESLKNLDSNINDPNPFGDIQVLEKQSWFDKYILGDVNGRKWEGPDGIIYSVDEEGYPTGRYFLKVIGSPGGLDYISTGGLGILVRLPKYLKYLKGIKSSKDLLKYAIKASDVFKLTPKGGKYKAVLEGGTYGAGQYFLQLVKNGWNYEKSANGYKLIKNGESIFFRASSSGKKGLDTFTLPKAYDGKNVDIFFK